MTKNGMESGKQRAEDIAWLSDCDVSDDERNRRFAIVMLEIRDDVREVQGRVESVSERIETHIRHPLAHAQLRDDAPTWQRWIHEKPKTAAAGFMAAVAGIAEIVKYVLTGSW